MKISAKILKVQRWAYIRNNNERKGEEEVRTSVRKNGT